MNGPLPFDVGGGPTRLDEDFAGPEDGLRYTEPRLADHVLAGLLGVVGGEGWRGPRGGYESKGPVAGALFDLAHSYAEGADAEPPATELGRKHAGAPAPGWLLPVAIVWSTRPDRDHETRALAIAGAVEDCLNDACVTYVELAAALLAGADGRSAIEAATGRPANAVVDESTVRPRPECDPDTPFCSGSAFVCNPGPAGCQEGVALLEHGPALCGIGPLDGITASVWALTRPEPTEELATALVTVCEPWVAAAALGLLGLRDGLDAIPRGWVRYASQLDLGGLATRLVAAGGRASAEAGARGAA